jgi:hypothetical protein
MTAIIRGCNLFREFANDVGQVAEGDSNPSPCDVAKDVWKDSRKFGFGRDHFSRTANWQDTFGKIRHRNITSTQLLPHDSPQSRSYSRLLMRGLQQANAFVIQFRDESVAGPHSGRIEHVSSGRTATFQSIKEIPDLLLQMLRRAASDEAPGSG